jgi:biopolymer transport protein ExbD
MVGHQLRCPKCGEMVSVPEPSQARSRSAARGAPAASPAAAETPVDLGSKREAVEADMDMTPMVDVTFLLLIFFMVTAAFALQKSIEIPKPSQDEASTNVVQKDPEEDPEYVTVFVDEFSTFHVTTLDWDVEAPSDQELIRKLIEARNGNSAGKVPTKLLVKAHGDAMHEKVVTALDAGTEVGMEQVQLVTVEESE